MIERKTSGKHGTARAGAVACVAVVIACSQGAVARAAEPTRALVICAQCVTDADSAIEGEVRDALGSDARFEVLPAPSLDLEAAQLSVDCTDQTAACLKKVASKLHAGVLLVTGVSRKRDVATLRLVYFDSGSSEAPRSLTRERSGAKPGKSWRNELPALLRELIGDGPKPAIDAATADTPSAAEPSPPAEPETATRSAAPERDAGGRGLPLPPLLLGGGGVALVVSGLFVGAAMRATERDYAAREITTAMQAELADEQRVDGQRQAVIANVLLGTGLVAMVASGVWLALELRQPEPAGSTRAALVPMLGPRVAGLSLAGEWEAQP